MDGWSYSIDPMIDQWTVMICLLTFVVVIDGCLTYFLFTD